MPTAALVLWIFAIVMAVFGLVFIAIGQNSERGYWSQRDPSGNARADATKLPAIIRRAGHFAAGDYRAPLRITAIGVIICEIAIVAAIIALVLTLTA